MKTLTTVLLLIMLASCSDTRVSGVAEGWPVNIKPPVPEKLTKEFTLHGDKRVDEYYWLNERTNPKVLDYLKAENAYLDTMMASTRDFQQQLFEEMKGRIKENDESLPYKDNGYFYYTRFQEGKQYPVFVRKKESLSAPEEILLDQNVLAEGFKYYAIAGRQVSDDNKILAYTVDTVSRRLYGLRFKNLETGADYPETIPNVEGGSIAWAADNKTVFYILKDLTTLLGYQVWRHELGTPKEKDVMVYEEKDNRYYLNLYKSKSDKYILIVSDMNEISTEYKMLEASNPTGTFSVFQPRQEGLQYYVEHFNDKFYIRTDLAAPNFRIMETPELQTSRENWKEVIPHRDNVYISGMTLFAKHLVLTEIKDALTQIRVIDATTKADHYIGSEEPVYTANVNINPDFNTGTLRY